MRDWLNNLQYPSQVFKLQKEKEKETKEISSSNKLRLYTFSQVFFGLYHRIS